MLNMNVKHVINHLVDNLLIIPSTDSKMVAFELQNKALHIHLDLRMSYYTKNPHHDHRTSRGLHLLYHRPKHSSYVNVFSAVLDSPFDKLRDVQEWKHEITHDSCWRDLNIFSSTYFTMANEINDSLNTHGYDSVPPCDMSQHNSFPIFGKMFAWVPVEVSKDPNCERSYRKLIKLL